MRSELSFGHGTDVERLPASVKVVKKEKGKDGDGTYDLTWIRIEQTIHLTVVVPVYNDKNHTCGLCDAVPPLPDTQGAEFILQNNDGARFSIPDAEDTDDERDRYPVTGWKHIDIDGQDVLVCKSCAGKVSSSIRKLKKKRAK